MTSRVDCDVDAVTQRSGCGGNLLISEVTIEMRTSEGNIPLAVYIDKSAGSAYLDSSAGELKCICK